MANHTEQTLEHTETDERGITYRLYITPDDIPIVGNVLASGDDEVDRRAEESTLGRLEAGETWAWALVEVEATWHGFTASDYLGGCSYADVAGFIQTSGYWQDMKETTRDSLIAQLDRAVVARRELAAREVNNG